MGVRARRGGPSGGCAGWDVPARVCGAAGAPGSCWDPLHLVSCPLLPLQTLHTLDEDRFRVAPGPHLPPNPSVRWGCGRRRGCVCLGCPTPSPALAWGQRLPSASLALATARGLVCSALCGQRCPPCLLATPSHPPATASGLRDSLVPALRPTRTM